MRFDYSDGKLSTNSNDLTLVFATNKKAKKELNLVPLDSFDEIDKEVNGALKNAAKTADFKAKKGEILNFYPENSNMNWVIVLGLGESEKIDETIFREAVGAFVKSINGKAKSIATKFPEDELKLSVDLISQSFAEGMLLGNYNFDKYKEKDEKKKSLENVEIYTKNEKKIGSGIDRGVSFAKATNLTRDLVNEQSTVATPTYLADMAIDIARKNKNIKCKIIDLDEAKELGMNAFLGIARASSKTTPPKFIHLEYTPTGKKSGKEKLALVGKGITFDSGGMNVKPGDHMMDMKIDMSGAAIVLGVFSVIEEIEPNYPVMGLIAATPNLISGNAIVPGDVVKAMSGKTIEILNTDAEGRVTMADTLSYAAKEKATKIIDFATLTGAAMVAMGHEITALFSNDEKLKVDILKSAKKSGDKMWELPLEESYKDQNKSEVADIANIASTRYGGTITAALFLEAFVEKDIKWAHLDIAGPAFLPKPTDIGPKGATGHGVRTVLNYLSI